jgi:hypothetical protein
VPRQDGVDEFFDTSKPVTLLITPLIELGSPQLDYVRCGAVARIRSALCVWSWDHLSSKALIRVVPTASSSGTTRSVPRPSAFTASGGHGRRHRRAMLRSVVRSQPARDRRRSAVASAFRRSPFILYVCSALFKNSPSEAASSRAG